MKKILIRVFIVLFILWFVVFCINIYRSSQDLRPILCKTSFIYQDGGSAEFYNIGYKVNYYCYMGAPYTNSPYGPDQNSLYLPTVKITKIGFYGMKFDKEKYAPMGREP